jgi:hypothetical protein
MSVDPSRRLTEISLLRLFLDALASHPCRSEAPDAAPEAIGGVDLVFDIFGGSVDGPQA